MPVGELIKTHGSRETGKPRAIPVGIENMLNRSFLLQPEEDGTRRRAQITEVVEEFEGQLDVLGVLIQPPLKVSVPPQ